MIDGEEMFFESGENGACASPVSDAFDCTVNRRDYENLKQLLSLELSVPREFKDSIENIVKSVEWNVKNSGFETNINTNNIKRTAFRANS